MNNSIELIGIYQLNHPSIIHIIELQVNEEIQEFDISKFTQEMEGQDKMNWQVPYDEKFLDSDNKVIGDWINIPTSLHAETKIVFFFHELNFDKPLITPYGELVISSAIDQPNWMKEIMNYEAP